MTSPGSPDRHSRVDMSPAAVTARLVRVSQLRRLCLALGKARTPDRAPSPGATHQERSR